MTGTYFTQPSTSVDQKKLMVATGPSTASIIR